MFSRESIFQKRSMAGCCIEHLGCLITFGGSYPSYIVSVMVLGSIYWNEDVNMRH